METHATENTIHSSETWLSVIYMLIYIFIIFLRCKTRFLAVYVYILYYIYCCFG